MTLQSTKYFNVDVATEFGVVEFDVDGKGRGDRKAEETLAHPSHTVIVDKKALKDKETRADEKVEEDKKSTKKPTKKAPKKATKKEDEK